MAGAGDMTTWRHGDMIGSGDMCLGFAPFSFSFVYFCFFSMVLQHVTGDCHMTDKFERHRAGHGGQGVMA
jgi:hypothetical protein